MINKRKAFIVGLKGPQLKFTEINFLKKHKPWGVILFSRNIKSINQTQKLTQHIRSIFKDDNYPILIDEGFNGDFFFRDLTDKEINLVYGGNAYLFS